jgi:hypothetical protein
MKNESVFWAITKQSFYDATFDFFKPMLGYLPERPPKVLYRVTAGPNKGKLFYDRPGLRRSSQLAAIQKQTTPTSNAKAVFIDRPLAGHK